MHRHDGYSLDQRLVQEDVQRKHSDDHAWGWPWRIQSLGKLLIFFFKKWFLCSSANTEKPLILPGIIERVFRMASIIGISRDSLFFLMPGSMNLSRIAIFFYHCGARSSPFLIPVFIMIIAVLLQKWQFPKRHRHSSENRYRNRRYVFEHDLKGKWPKTSRTVENTWFQKNDEFTVYRTKVISNLALAILECSAIKSRNDKTCSTTLMWASHKA